MTSEGLGEMFEGDSADMFARKCLLVSMGGRAKGLASADPGARTPIGASGNFTTTTTNMNITTTTEPPGHTMPPPGMCTGCPTEWPL